MLVIHGCLRLPDGHRAFNAVHAVAILFQPHLRHQRFQNPQGDIQIQCILFLCPQARAHGTQRTTGHPSRMRVPPIHSGRPA